MAKSSITCTACGEENDPTSTFCLNCGASLSQGEEVKKVAKVDEEEEDIDTKILRQKQSLPFLVAVCVFLVFIDFIDDSAINWAYWPVIPIILFGMLAPYYALKIEKQNKS